MYGRKSATPVQPIEKVISILSYLTCGFVGVVWLLIGYFAKLSLKPFLKYHIMQSIFLSVLFFILGQIFNFIFSILLIIPGIKILANGIMWWFISPIFIGLSLPHIMIIFLTIYLCIGVVNERYSFIPWVSNIIDINSRR